MSNIQLSDQVVARVRAEFAAQKVMAELHATLEVVESGVVEISAPFDPRFTQQDGFWHAGIVTTLVDSATGFAAFSMMPMDKRVLAVEFKMNFVRPAVGERFIARGQVVKPGKTLTIVTGTVWAETGDTRKEIAFNQCTMMAVDA